MKVTLKNSDYKNLKERMKTPEFKRTLKSDAIKLFATIGFTFIYGIGMNWFLLSSVIPMYSGGVPGLSQLILDACSVGGVTFATKGFLQYNVILGMIVFLLNIPIILLGWFKVSKRFTIFSLVSIIIQSTVLSFMKIQPIIEAVRQLDPIINSIIGGIFVGVGIGGTLRFGSSTGGFDIVGQYLAHKTGKSVGFISTTINILIAVLGAFILSFGKGTTIEVVKGASVFHTITGTPIHEGGVSMTKVLSGAAFGFSVFSYTAIRLLVSMLVTDRLHTTYNFMEVNIITNKPIELTEALINKMGRGVTLFDVRGGYGYNEKQMILIVIFSHEIATLKDLIREHDPRAFMTLKDIDSLMGNFKKKTR